MTLQNILKKMKLLLFFIPDKLYLKLYYYCVFKKALHINDPKTYNEKIQWLKLYDRNPIYIDIVDKFKVRNYVNNTIGERYLVPLLGVYDSFEEIDFSSLPAKFVMKCTHDSGGVYICKDKNLINYPRLKKQFKIWLNTKYYRIAREWPYKYVKPRILIEEYLETNTKQPIRDYKFFCFNGKVQALFVASDRGIDTRFDFFDRNFNHLPFIQHYKNFDRYIERPEDLDIMIEIAERLGNSSFPHVRVDLYNLNGIIFFGEMTLYHFGGAVPFEPPEWDEIFGEWITLPAKSLKK